MKAHNKKAKCCRPITGGKRLRATIRALLQARAATDTQNRNSYSCMLHQR